MCIMSTVFSNCLAILLYLLPVPLKILTTRKLYLHQKTFSSEDGCQRKLFLLSVPLKRARASLSMYIFLYSTYSWTVFFNSYIHSTLNPNSHETIDDTITSSLASLDKMAFNPPWPDQVFHQDINCLNIDVSCPRIITARTPSGSLKFTIPPRCCILLSSSWR